MSCCCHEPTGESATDNSVVADGARWIRLGGLVLLGGLTMYLSLALNLTPAPGDTHFLIHGVLAVATAGALAIGGRPILRRAWSSRLNLEHLFLLALAGTFAASLYASITRTGFIYYEVVVILLAIYQFGQLVLNRQAERTNDLSRHIPGLTGVARVVKEGTVHETPIERIVAGDTIEIPAEAVVPADGTVATGSAFVEEMTHTGEPFPAPKHTGDRVLAGSRVLDGTIRITATSAGTNRELDRLVAACRDREPTPAESLAQRVLTFFIPAVLAIALGTAGFWLALGRPTDALLNSLAVTVVACPCGLGIAIPLAIKRGLLGIRLLGLVPFRPDILERLAEIDTLAFDKTGTLSHPRLVLNALDTAPDAPDDLPRWLASIQRRSTHPVARPFWNLAEAPPLEDLDIIPIPGRGLRARFATHGKRRTLVIGNDDLLRERDGESANPSGRTLHVWLDDRLVATARLTESPRESAPETLRLLHESGLRTEILTGDSGSPDRFRKHAAVHTGLTAAEKAERTREIGAAGRTALFVGDGLNDTEAMLAAHASIAIQSGSPAAASVATAALAHDDLSVLPRVLDLARDLRRRLVRILAFTLCYNFTGIALAVTGALHPIAAAFLMFASSVTVVAWAARQDIAGK